MKDLKLYYNSKDFDSFEAAQADFLRNWAAHNPLVKRQADNVGESETAKNYQGVHHRDGRWYFCTEVKNFMNFDPEQTKSGADNTIKNCPRCGKPGSVRAVDWFFSLIYIHISAVENDKEIPIVFCPIPRQKADGLIDASTF